MSNPTMNALSLKAVLEEAATQFLKTQGYDQPKGNGKAKPEPKAAPKARPNAAEYDKLVIAAFKKAGFADPKPRENIKTYNLWLGQNMKVKAGEKSIKVRQFRLFHVSQVEPLAAPTPAKPPKSSKGAKAIKAAKAVTA